MNRLLRLLFLSIIISCSTMLINVPARSVDEYDLFQEGYDLYLSCEPAKASDRFRIFLREFPDSSAKDTVLFWLGKALMQMGEHEESERVFKEIRRDFPDSIFASYALKEMERMKTLMAVPELRKEGTIDNEIKAIRAERDRLASLLEEGRKKIEACEGRSMEIDGLVKEKAALEERLKEVEKEKLIELSRIKEERDGLIAKIQKAQEEIALSGKMKGDLEALLKEKDKEIEGLKGEIDKRHKEIEDYRVRIQGIKASMEEKEAILKKLTVAEEEIQGKTEEIRRILEEKDKMGKELLEMKERVTSTEGAIKEVERNKALIEAREKEIEELRRKIQGLQEEQKKIAGDLRVAEEEKKKGVSELIRLKDEFSRLSAERDLLKTDLLEASERLARLKEKEEENRKLEERLSESNKRVSSLESEIKVVKEEKERIKGERERLMIMLKDKTEENEAYRERLANAEKRTSEMEVLKKELEEGRKKIEACEGRSMEIDGLVKEKAALEERLKEVEKEKLIELSRIKEERDGLIAKIQKAQEEIALSGKMKGDLEALLREKDKEIEGLRMKVGSLEKNIGELRSARERAEKEALDARMRMEEIEKRSNPEIEKLRKEGERLQSLLSEEKKRAEDASSKIMALQEREKELLGLNASLKNIMESRISDVGSRLQTCERDLSEVKKEKAEKEFSIQGMSATIKNLESEIERLRGFEIEAKRLKDRLNEGLQFEKMVSELQKRLQDKERDGAELRARLKEREDELSRLKIEKSEIERHMAELKDKIKEGVRFITIGKERFSRDYISSYMFRSQILFGKLGIRDIPWRSGDLYNDFINEQVLYDEAKNIEKKDLRDLKGILLQNKDEIEYLKRFNLISYLLNQELKKLSPEISAEAILFPYSEGDIYENAAKVVNIQNDVKSGLSIREIVKSYPGAEYRILSESDIHELFGDLSNRFSDGEVVSTFNKERFMVIQIKEKPVEYRPFDPPSQIVDKRLREYISKWILTQRAKRDIRFSD